MTFLLHHRFQYQIRGIEQLPANLAFLQQSVRLLGRKSLMESKVPERQVGFLIDIFWCMQPIRLLG